MSLAHTLPTEMLMEIFKYLPAHQRFHMGKEWGWKHLQLIAYEELFGDNQILNWWTAIENNIFEYFENDTDTKLPSLIFWMICQKPNLQWLNWWSRQVVLSRTEPYNTKYADNLMGSLDVKILDWWKNNCTSGTSPYTTINDDMRISDILGYLDAPHSSIIQIEGIYKTMGDFWGPFPARLDQLGQEWFTDWLKACGWLSLGIQFHSSPHPALKDKVPLQIPSRCNNRLKLHVLNNASTNGSVDILDWWRKYDPPYLQSTYTKLAMDRAKSPEAVLQWWKESGLFLWYTRESIDNTRTSDILEWWKGSGLKLKSSSPDALDWWVTSGLKVMNGSTPLDTFSLLELQ